MLESTANGMPQATPSTVPSNASADEKALSPRLSKRSKPYSLFE
jgi:hypothetical protein